MTLRGLTVSVCFCFLTLCFGQEEAGLVLAEQEGSGLENAGVIGPGAGFREIGSYRVSGSSLIHLGKATEVAKGEMLFRVFTDGVDIRLSPDGDQQSYLAFQIYRDGGVFDESGENLLPGVQAFSDQGGVVRHLVVEPRLLTLTKFPSSSSNIEIIYAIRDSQ